MKRDWLHVAFEDKFATLCQPFERVELGRIFFFYIFYFYYYFFILWSTIDKTTINYDFLKVGSNFKQFDPGSIDSYTKI